MKGTLPKWELVPSPGQHRDSKWIFPSLQLWRVLLGSDSSSSPVTASRSPLALKDVKCCSVSDVSSWPQPHFSAGTTSEPCWRPYYEINPCRQWGEAHQLHFNSISSGMLSFTLFWRCSCEQRDTHSPLGVSFAGMHSNEFFFSLCLLTH